TRIALGLGHVPRPVEHAQIGIAQVRRQPGGRDEIVHHESLSSRWGLEPSGSRASSQRRYASIASRPRWYGLRTTSSGSSHRRVAPCSSGCPASLHPCVPPSSALTFL